MSVNAFQVREQEQTTLKILRDEYDQMQTLLQMTQSDCSDLASRTSSAEKSRIPRKASASSPSSPSAAAAMAAAAASRRAAAAPSPSPSTLTTLSPSSSPETTDTPVADRHGHLNMSDIYASFSEVGDGEGELEGDGAKGVAGNSFSLDLIYTANGNDPDTLDISDVNMMKNISKPSSPARPSPASSSPQQQQQLVQHLQDDDSLDLDEPFPDLPPPPLPSSNSSDDLGFPAVDKPRKLSLGAVVVGTGAAVGSTARRATIASNFDRMSTDIATKFAGVKVNVQHPTKKHKTYMPYMGSLAAAVGMKKDSSATSTSAGGKKK